MTNSDVVNMTDAPRHRQKKGWGAKQIAENREAIMPHLPVILKNIVDAAKNGDTHSARWLVERCTPSIRSQHAPVKVPGINGCETMIERAECIARAALNGEISIDVGERMMSMLTQFAALNDLEGLINRLEALEREIAAGRPVTVDNDGDIL